jgi:hypothetical protein
MNKYKVYIGLLVVFFIVFLGMRNPGLNHKPGPKRNSRAIITQTINKNLSASSHKSSKDQDCTTPLAILLSTIGEGNTPALALLLVADDQSSPYPLYSSICSSRAPPLRFPDNPARS